MDDFTQYVTSVNKIFEYVEQMKSGWNSLDNNNYIETISEYKNVLTEKAEDFKKKVARHVEEQYVENHSEQMPNQVENQQPQINQSVDTSMLNQNVPTVANQTEMKVEGTNLQPTPVEQVQPSSLPPQPLSQAQPARVEQMPKEIESIQLPASPQVVQQVPTLQQGN